MKHTQSKTTCEEYRPPESDNIKDFVGWELLKHMNLSREFTNHVSWSYIPSGLKEKYNYLMLLLNEDNKIFVPEKILSSSIKIYDSASGKWGDGSVKDSEWNFHDYIGGPIHSTK